MNPRPPRRNGLGLPQDYACDGCRVALAEREELQQIRDGIAFGPSEVRMPDLAGLVPDVQQQRRDCVRDRGTRASEHAFAAITLVFASTTLLNIYERPEGITRMT